jgi:predicted regulator of amino acid metabolism with ACT domain
VISHYFKSGKKPAEIFSLVKNLEILRRTVYRTVKQYRNNETVARKSVMAMGQVARVAAKVRLEVQLEVMQSSSIIPENLK